MFQRSHKPTRSNFITATNWERVGVDDILAAFELFQFHTDIVKRGSFFFELFFRYFWIAAAAFLQCGGGSLK
jgi:hypothetical protein